MPKIDPHASWLPLERRAAEENDPRRKRLLTAVRDHMEHEIKGHLPELMDTLTAEPIYHFWGSEPSVLEGRAAVEGFYNGMFASGGQQFEVVVERIVVDDNSVVTEGQVKQVHKGAALKAMGMAAVNGSPIGDDDLLLTTAQLVTVWPADSDGRLIGEDIYFGHEPMRNIERITAADLPDYYAL